MLANGFWTLCYRNMLLKCMCIANLRSASGYQLRLGAIPLSEFIGDFFVVRSRWLADFTGVCLDNSRVQSMVGGGHRSCAVHQTGGYIIIVRSKHEFVYAMFLRVCDTHVNLIQISWGYHLVCQRLSKSQRCFNNSLKMYLYMGFAKWPRDSHWLHSSLTWCMYTYVSWDSRGTLSMLFSCIKQFRMQFLRKFS